MTICHCLLQYTTYMLSYQSKGNELRDARDVFFQWLSGHSQTGKYLVDLYRTEFSMGTLSHGIYYRTGISIAVTIRSPDPSLSAQLRDLLSHWDLYRVPMIYPLA